MASFSQVCMKLADTDQTSDRLASTPTSFLRCVFE